MKSAHKPGRLRVIGGQWRSRIVEFSDAKDLRPTPDRVRQTVFDWLSPRIEGARCLDLYAGSGAMGIEALSRGASHSCFVDQGQAQINSIGAALAKLGAEEGARQLICAEAGAFLASDTQLYHVIFVDPPYQSAQHSQILAQIEARLAPDHRVYVEWSGPRPELSPDWQWLREKRAGRVSFGLLKFNRGESA